MASMVAGAAVLALLAGIAVAKKPTDDGSHGKGHGKAWGHGSHGGGPHGHADGHGHGHGGPRRGGAACQDAASAIGAFVDAACPCAGADDGSGGTLAWKNHGQYVRCVAHAVRDAARAAGVKRQCGRRLVRCAARSTCGKGDAVACVVTAGGTCVFGVCSDDTAVACSSDADCAVRECSVRSAAECTALGGSGGSGSCCTASPAGAFLD